MRLVVVMGEYVGELCVFVLSFLTSHTASLSIETINPTIDPPVCSRAGNGIVLEKKE